MVGHYYSISVRNSESVLPENYREIVTASGGVEDEIENPCLALRH